MSVWFTYLNWLCIHETFIPLNRHIQQDLNESETLQIEHMSICWEVCHMEQNAAEKSECNSAKLFGHSESTLLICEEHELVDINLLSLGLRSDRFERFLILNVNWLSCSCCGLASWIGRGWSWLRWCGSRSRLGGWCRWIGSSALWIQLFFSCQ